MSSAKRTSDPSGQSSKNRGVGAYCYAQTRHVKLYTESQLDGVYGIWNAVFDNSTGHGYQQTNHARGAVKNIFWVLAIIIMSGALVFGIQGLLVRYFRYRLQVGITVNQQQTLPFPAVTICNMSPVKKSEISHLSGSKSGASGITTKRRKKRGTYCQSGWSYYNGACYATCGISVTSWSQANNWCISQGAQLTSISDSNELNFVKSISINTYAMSYWIGLYKTSAAINSATYWLDGNNSTYRKWNSGEPGSTDQCVILTTAGGFSDDKCTDKNPQCVCKGTTSYCPSQWSLYNGNCFAVCGVSVYSWSNANTWCKSQGAQLASISDANELSFVISISTAVSPKSYWIGLLKSTSSQTSPTYWMNGNPSTYRKWDSGQPGSTATCVVLTTKGGFADDTCSDNAPQCVCELDPITLPAAVTTQPVTTTMVPTTQAATTTQVPTTQPTTTTKVTTSPVVTTTIFPTTQLPTTTMVPTTPVVTTTGVLTTQSTTSTIVPTTPVATTTTVLTTQLPTSTNNPTTTPVATTADVSTTQQHTTILVPTTTPVATTITDVLTTQSTSSVIVTTTPAAITTTVLVTTQARTSTEVYTTISSTIQTTEATSTQSTPLQTTTIAPATTTISTTGLQTTSFVGTSSLTTTAATTTEAFVTTTGSNEYSTTTTDLTTSSTYTPLISTTTEATTAAATTTSTSTASTSSSTTAVIAATSTTETVADTTTAVTTPERTSQPTTQLPTTVPTPDVSTTSNEISTVAPTTRQETTALFIDATSSTTDDSTAVADVTSTSTSFASSQETTTNVPPLVTTSFVASTKATSTISISATNSSFTWRTFPDTSSTSGFFSTPQSTMTSPAETLCCCRCCPESSATSSSSSSCKQCLGESPTDATSCAANKLQEIPYVKPFVPSATASFKSPTPMEGSQYPGRPSLTVAAQQQQQLTETLASLPESTKAELGFRKTDLIVDCSFNGVPCQIDEDFVQFYNPTLGNCYVFNSGWNTTFEPVKLSTRPGKQYGLSLIANVQQDEYSVEVGSTAGIIVLPLPQNIMPFPEDDGILLSPGHAASVALTTHTIERSPAPYGDCTDANGDRNTYSQYYPVNYSTAACLKTCFQRLTVKTCGCADPYYPVDIDARVSVCSSSNITQSDCLYAMSLRFTNDTVSCGCPDRCSDTILYRQYSISAWPSLKSKAQLMNYLKPKLPSTFNVHDDQLIAKNLVKLDLFYKDLVVMDTSQSADYPFTQLLTDFGGTVGLWLGLAVMTSMEILEFVVDIAVCSIARLCSTARSRTTDATRKFSS